MHNNAIDRAVLEIRRPLVEAIKSLSRRTSRIRTAWIKLMGRYNACAKYPALIPGFHPHQRLRDFCSADPKTYREETENQGRDLARKGVPAECAMLAVALYVETFLPYMIPNDTQAPRWRRALIRWSSMYQFFLMSGYAQHAAEEMAILTDKAAQAERRAQAFSVELGEAYEKERRRLAQDLHDEIGHDLIVLKLYTQVIALDLKKGDVAQVRRKLKESVSLLKHALTGVRHLTFDLGPAIWSEQGFIPAVRLYTRQFATRTGLHVRFDALRLRIKLPLHYETALYKVMQGALSNVAAHAGARNVKITLASRPDGVVMRVEDDGRGFDVGSKLRRPPHSFGLRAMRDRIELLGGTIRFQSQTGRRSAHRGTIIELHLPLPGTEAAV